jgi:hypothetical protein
MFILAKDANGQTVRRTIVPDEAEAWDVATGYLEARSEIVRVIFFSKQFTFVNALSRPEYFNREDAVLSEEEKQALITLDQL